MRDSVCRAILRNMTPEDVRDEFSSKQHQVQSIKCQINELLSRDEYMPSDIQVFLQELGSLLE